jgi:hypothetical protein
MLLKYTLEYTTQVRRHGQPSPYSANDAVACEELLERGFASAIKHESVELPEHEFDRIVKTGACTLASKHIFASHGVKTDEEKFRFEFTA